MQQTHQVDYNRVAKEEGKGKKHPGQKRGLEVEEAQEVHMNERVSSAPYITVVGRCCCSLVWLQVGVMLY